MPHSSRHFDDFRQPKKIEEGGLLRLSGAFIVDHEGELLNLIKNEAKNPEQISKIEKIDGSIYVHVNNHSLANHLGKALVRAYKGEHSFKFLKGEKFVEVDWRRDD